MPHHSNANHRVTDSTGSIPSEIELVIDSPTNAPTLNHYYSTMHHKNNANHRVTDSAGSSHPEIDLVIDSPNPNRPTPTRALTIIPFIARFHAGYFRISLSLCSQALLWKTLRDPPAASPDPAALRRLFRTLLPAAAFTALWSLSLLTLVTLSSLYALRCLSHFHLVRNEFKHHVGVNYMFAPWISWLLLLQSSPFISPTSTYYLTLWWLFVVPIVALDVKIYGAWFTKGKSFLSAVANPTSHLSVIGNLVGAWAGARMEWRESAVCLFSLGMAHYLVLFVTLYQRLPGGNGITAMLRPVFFLFFAAPSVASLACEAIWGSFDYSSKMLFFLSLFLFLSLVSRPMLFKKSMKKFSVAWWAYSFPLTVLAIASTEYAQKMKSTIAHVLMLVLSLLSVLVSLVLMVFTGLNTNMLLPIHDPYSS
ncbi:hypothetical protein RHMOL_Rhmol04G0078400 [Rhododendron molle]|uniref:Uncharacterized protein n=1 Tax=Rhododendron molle TaxID=49168 RepID=A0ACC0NY22_RHOML|nr:hypothetical protein RHMOL_Rhmol04G0078400 [Rhododendron molle]